VLSVVGFCAPFGSCFDGPASLIGRCWILCPAHARSSRPQKVSQRHRKCPSPTLLRSFPPNTLRSIIKMQTLVENFLAFIFPHNCITSAATFRQLKMGEQSFHMVKQESLLSRVSRFSLTHKNDLLTISPKYPQMP
jgi:hypothetical protein